MRFRLKILSWGYLFGITRLAEWCWTVIPSDGIFNSNQTSITGSFSCMLFFWQLHLGLKMLFYQFYAKNNIFFIKKCLIWLLSYTLTLKYLAKTDTKMMSRRQKWLQNFKIVILISCTCRLTLPHVRPPHVRQHFLAQVGFKEIPDRYARNHILCQLTECGIWFCIK